MADSNLTVADVFDLPKAGSPEESSPRWQSLHTWINEEMAAMKSPTMEDIRSTIEDLLKIPVSEIFLNSWKETDAIKNLLAESPKEPGAVTNVELADHTIKSQHHPHIEVRQKKGTSKKIEFRLRLLFKLQTFSLRIQNGLITEMRTGPCEMQGTLEYQGLAVAEQKSAPIDLPEVVAFNDEPKVEVKEPAPVKTALPVTVKEPPNEPAPIEPAPPAPLIAPKAMAAAALTTKVAPKIIEPAAPPATAPEKVQSSPDFSSLIPSQKITPQETERVPPPNVSDSAPGVAPTEEEEREVFVL